MGVSVVLLCNAKYSPQKKGKTAVSAMAFDDVFQTLQIARERAPTGGGKRHDGRRFIRVADFAQADQACLFERAQVRGEIAIGEFQAVAQFCEGQRFVGGEDGHDGEARLGVNGRRQFVERRAVDGQFRWAQFAEFICHDDRSYSVALRAARRFTCLQNARMRASRLSATSTPRPKPIWVAPKPTAMLIIA